MNTSSKKSTIKKSTKKDVQTSENHPAELGLRRSSLSEKEQEHESHSEIEEEENNGFPFFGPEEVSTALQLSPHLLTRLTLFLLLLLSLLFL
jgi:hypothetical protein